MNQYALFPFYIYFNNSSLKINEYLVYPDSIGFSSDFCDKNENTIYSGDIILITNGQQKTKFFVEYVNSAFYLFCIDEQNISGKRQWGLLNKIFEVVSYKDIEIIDNKFKVK